MLRAGQLVMEAAQEVIVPVLVAVIVPVRTTGYEVVEVTVERAGQLVTVAAHEVMVTTSVT